MGFVIVSLSVHAQYGSPPPYYPPPQRGLYRSGLVFGFGVGAGAITASDCSNCGGGAGGLEIHLGGMVTPRLAVMAELWSLLRPLGGGVTLSNTIFSGALQYWATDQFWLKGGLGSGTVDLSDDYSGATFDSETAFAMSGALGFEVLQMYNFALDLQLRLAHVFYASGGANNIAFMVGFNWY